MASFYTRCELSVRGRRSHQSGACVLGCAWVWLTSFASRSTLVPSREAAQPSTWILSIVRLRVLTENHSPFVSCAGLFSLFHLTFSYFILPFDHFVSLEFYPSYPIHMDFIHTTGGTVRWGECFSLSLSFLLLLTFYPPTTWRIPWHPENIAHALWIYP